MTIAAENEIEHIGESQGAANHDHDMIHELSRRLDAYWRYDQYEANADIDKELQKFWRDVKAQEEKTIERLKGLIAKHCEKGCF